MIRGQSIEDDIASFSGPCLVYLICSIPFAGSWFTDYQNVFLVGEFLDFHGEPSQKVR